MNVLEKILKEIEEKNKIADDCNENLAFIDGVRYGLIEAKKIIRSHMNDGKDTNVPSNWIPCSERLPEEGKEVLAQFVVRVRHTNGQVDEMVYISFALRGREMEKLSRNAERKGGSMATASRTIQKRKRK